MKTNLQHNQPRPRGHGWLSAIAALALIASHSSARAQDTTPPVLTSVVANCDGTEVIATFSETLEPISASDPFNYFFLDAQGNWIGVNAATLGPDNQTVTLAYLGSAITPGGSYTLGIVPYSVQDPAGNVNGDQSLPVQFAPIPPAVTCSVARSVLSPLNLALVNVGLQAASSAGTVQVQVFSDERKIGPLQDAKYEGGILKLRSRINPYSDGRVYLIVVSSTDACGNTGVCCSTVVVPKNGTARALAAVQAQAAAAQAQCSASGSPLTPYRILP